MRPAALRCRHSAIMRTYATWWQHAFAERVPMCEVLMPGKGMRRRPMYHTRDRERIHGAVRTSMKRALACSVHHVAAYLVVQF